MTKAYADFISTQQEKLKGAGLIEDQEEQIEVTDEDIEWLEQLTQEQYDQMTDDQKQMVYEAEKWIAKAIEHPGALRRQLGTPEGKNIPRGKLEAAAKKGGALGKRARLAMTLSKLRKK